MTDVKQQSNNDVNSSVDASREGSTGAAAGSPPPASSQSSAEIVDGVIQSNTNEVYESFDDMQLKEDLLRGIYAFGFEVGVAVGVFKRISKHH